MNRPQQQVPAREQRPAPAHSMSEIIRRLDTITAVANAPEQIDVNPTDVNLSMAEHIRQQVKQGHSALFEHAISEVDATIRLLEVMRDSLAHKLEEANTRTDEFCTHITDLLLKNTQIHDSAKSLGQAVLDNRVT